MHSLQSAKFTEFADGTRLYFASDVEVVRQNPATHVGVAALLLPQFPLEPGRANGSVSVTFRRNPDRARGGIDPPDNYPQDITAEALLITDIKFATWAEGTVCLIHSTNIRGGQLLRIDWVCDVQLVRPA